MSNPFPFMDDGIFSTLDQECPDCMAYGAGCICGETTDDDESEDDFDEE